MKKVMILGEEWAIHETDEAHDIRLKELTGYCDSSTRSIVIDDMRGLSTDPMARGDLTRYKRQVLRHELIHAFLSEAGLEDESWAKNEEIVDFFALQFPKLKTIFSSVNAED